MHVRVRVCTSNYKYVNVVLYHYVVTVCMYAYVFDSEDNAQFCSVTLNMTVQSFQVLVVRTGFIRQFYQRSCMIKR